MMGYKIIPPVPGRSVAAVGGDPFFSSVELLVANETGKADGNTAFIDQSSNGFTVTPNGAAQWDTGITPPSPMDASFQGGTGRSLTILDNAILEPGSGDFTLEMFIYTTATTQGRILTKGTYATGSVDIGLISDSQAVFLELSSNGTSADILSDFLAGIGQVPTASWSYIAVRRSGTSITSAYKNVPVAGQATSAGAGATSSAAINNSATGWTIGNDNNNSFHNGNIFSVRYTGNVARDITVVPTFPFPTS